VPPDCIPACDPHASRPARPPAAHRFGTITSCDIIRDFKTGDSLCYAFIGYDSEEACVAAYFKMNNVSIDDRRIKVDFSQSVSHIWRQFKKFGKKGGNADMGKEADTHQVRSGAGVWSVVGVGWVVWVM
jgi:peptidyl-prolyl cis-trans isomerase-like 4